MPLRSFRISIMALKGEAHSYWEAADAQTHHAAEIRWVVTARLYGDEKTVEGGPMHQYCLTSCFASQSLIPASQK